VTAKIEYLSIPPPPSAHYDVAVDVWIEDAAVGVGFRGFI
jgi:hypothetical protein